MARSMPYEDQAGDDGQRECARASWCSDPRLIRNDSGGFDRLPALTPRAFCLADRAAVLAALESLPSAWDRLTAAIGDPPRGAQALRVPFGPRLPLRADIDALARLMADTLASWHERVATVVPLMPVDTDVSRRDLALTVKNAASTLAINLDVLLSLHPEPMRRVLHPDAADEWMADPQADGIVRADAQAHTLLPLSGADAGLEILDLHYRARRILGETRTPPETFDGIPCKHCETMSLERAEPPSDPTRPAMHSRCASCHHMMDRKDFDQWAAWYAGWATKLELACKRCQAKPPRCAECAWDRCSCAAQGHAGAARFA